MPTNHLKRKTLQEGREKSTFLDCIIAVGKDKENLSVLLAGDAE